MGIHLEAMIKKISLMIKYKGEFGLDFSLIFFKFVYKIFNHNFSKNLNYKDILHKS